MYNRPLATTGCAQEGRPDLGMVKRPFSTYFSGLAWTSPIAFRTGAPGSLVSLLQQSVGITSVGGETVSARNSLPLDDAPQGAFGEVDILLLAPGSITVNLETAGIPAGTSVEVTAKERRGGNLISGLAALIAGNCDGTGLCQAATSLDLAAGLYVLEARATFQP